ncbi:hypothetical protein [Atlantibacter subterraneus]|jgi:hypothetical protein|uniref:hypothetical protein n=1 Tax=Atlantibacter subterraneus TaxID=255519 RepID=UPI001182ADFF|nr:hypothetical protein [Atlantibacter subterranea]TSJ57682.1 hypothetical protein FND52_06455 [Atlantibacter subterranea]UTJ46405.1 hypothetical protein NLZ15_16345 [Atlantibacter subterranea]
MSEFTHDILHDELQGFDVFRYTDIRFTFAKNPLRQITFRLVFCKETGNNAWLKTRYGAELASLTVNVVSFHNIDALNNDQCETLFVKPPDAPDLNASEVLYLYRTLIDIILQIAEIAQIQVLTFQAYSEELRRIYDRLVKRYVLTRNLHIMTEGAYYVIRTGRRKDERSN